MAMFGKLMDSLLRLHLRNASTENRRRVARWNGCLLVCVSPLLAIISIGGLMSEEITAGRILGAALAPLVMLVPGILAYRWGSGSRDEVD